MHKGVNDMNFLELEVGKRFVLIRENDNRLVYIKLNENKHNNASYNGMVFSVHGCSQVKVVE